MSIDKEKSFDKLQHHCMIKALRKLGTHGQYLNIVKTIYEKPIANIIVYGEKLKPFSLKSGMRLGSPLFPLLFNIVLEFLARAFRQEKEIKGIQIGKETVKISLFADDMILYLKDLKNSTPKFLDTINSYTRWQDTKSTYKNQAFLYTNNKQTEKEYVEMIPFTISSKTNQIPGSKLNKGCE
jgi:hypothetical protein